jgi:serine/threonine protein kinase/tetratricopeptide (TPR) repeat protein
MNDDSGQDVVIFSEAINLPEAERTDYVARACAGDTDLRNRVEALLRAYRKVDHFMREPAPGLTDVIGQAPTTGEKPGDWIGRYKLLQQIGEGGYGMVFMAEQTEPIHRRVALKIIKPGMDTKCVIARFEAERQALAMMDHPSIAKVFDAGATESGRPYFVMELIRGIKITEYCDQQSLTTEERLKLFIQVCQAAQHAHQKGIIHRDIKPPNILVTTSVDGAALPVVIDFGIAKATTNQRLTDKTLFTAFEMFIGTPAYMSPEQAALTSEDVDTRTDIYSLGVLLYELLTGSTPFDGGKLLKVGLDEIRRVIREQEPDRPSTRLSKMTQADITTVAQRRQSEPPKLIRSVHGDLDWIVMKALEKDRRRRYETANGLALDVQRFLDSETISARPPSTLYKFQKTVERNRLLFTGIGVIVILLIVSLILVSESLAKERQSQLEARQVKQFLEEMLKGVEPEVALGRDTTILREILDKAAARIDKETNQPAVAAELRSVIGTVYERTDQYHQAEAMQRSALAICRESFGRESPETAAALNELGVTLIANGKWLEAEQVNREALEIRQRHFGDENADVATSEDNLAHACYNNGKFTEAEALIRKALATRRRLFGNESLEVMDSLRNQEIILGNSGQWAEAEATAREVLALRRKLLGPQDPSVAGALSDLAWAATGNGDHNEAEAAGREALGLRQKVLSDNVPEVAESLYHVGDHLRQHGNLEDAYSVLGAALSLFRKSLGNDHPYTLYTLSDLGLVCEAETNWPESETVFRQALASWRKQAGDDDPQTLYTMRNLAGALEGQGKWAEAETLHRKALASWRKRSGNEDGQTLWECDGLYHDLVSQRKDDEAEQFLAEVLTPAFIKNPVCSSILAHRLDLMGRQGRWQAAIVDAATIMRYKPAEYYWTYVAAGLLVTTQKRSAYHQICQKILPMFASTTDCYTAQRVADDCLLLPDSGANLQTVDKLADFAVASTNDTIALPYFQTCKALSEYRQGNFLEAAAWAAKSLDTSQNFAGAKGCAVLAMADWQLGHKNEARAMLAKGNTLAPRLSTTNTAVDLGDSWVAWLFARVSLDEAGALIEH